MILIKTYSCVRTAQLKYIPKSGWKSDKTEMNVHNAQQFQSLYEKSLWWHTLKFRELYVFEVMKVLLSVEILRIVMSVFKCSVTDKNKIHKILKKVTTCGENAYIPELLFPRRLVPVSSTQMGKKCGSTWSDYAKKLKKIKLVNRNVINWTKDTLMCDIFFVKLGSRA